MLFSVPSISATTIIENQILTNHTTSPSDYTPGLTINNDTIVRNCTIIGYYIGILVTGNNNTIEYNNIVGGTDGVQCRTSASHNVIKYNYLQKNNYSIVIWWGSNNITITNNTFTESTYAALDIRNTENLITRDITIKGNVFNYNSFNYVYKKNDTIPNLSIYNNTYNNNSNLGNTTNWDELYWLFDWDVHSEIVHADFTIRILVILCLFFVFLFLVSTGYIKWKLKTKK